MKNIAIITPFYPYPNNKNLIKDSSAIYYLIKNKKEDENIIIIYYYQHTRLRAFKNLPKILKLNSFVDCLYKDDIGNDILLFEHPCLIPHSFRTLSSFDKKYAKMLECYLKEKRITLDSLVVHFPVSFSPFAKMINARRKIAICHSFDVEKGRDEITRKYNDFYDEIGFRSPQIRNKYHKFEKSHGYLCLSGVPDYFIGKKRTRSWKNDGILRICFAGKLVKNKNVENVIYALKQLENRFDFVFSIIGDGEELVKLQRTTKQLGLDRRIHFLGCMSRKDVFEKFLENDIFVMASFKETLGLVYLEAMAAGDLIIASRDRGIDGLIDDGKGVLFVDPESIDSIVNAFEQYANMSIGEAQLLQSELYAVIKQYPESFVSRSYLNMAYGENVV